MVILGGHQISYLNGHTRVRSFHHPIYSCTLYIIMVLLAAGKLISQLQTYVPTIQAAAKKAQTQASRCKSLSERVKAQSLNFNCLMYMNLQPAAMAQLFSLVQCVEECFVLIDNCSRRSSLFDELMHFTGSNIGQFDELNKRLDSIAHDLTLSLQIQAQFQQIMPTHNHHIAAIEQHTRTYDPSANLPEFGRRTMVSNHQETPARQWRTLAYRQETAPVRNFSQLLVESFSRMVGALLHHISPHRSSLSCVVDDVLIPWALGYFVLCALQLTGIVSYTRMHFAFSILIAFQPLVQYIAFKYHRGHFATFVNLQVCAIGLATMDKYYIGSKFR